MTLFFVTVLAVCVLSVYVGKAVVALSLAAYHLYKSRARKGF